MLLRTFAVYIKLGVTKNMRPYTVASICASLVSCAIALVGALEALDRTQRGYRLTGHFLLEIAATTALYFIVVFVLVAKFPTWPAKGLLALQRTFALSSLRTPAQRLSFVVMCAGLVTLAVTAVAYYMNGHDGLPEYWFGGHSWVPRSYSTWLWTGLLGAIIGLCGSFLRNFLVNPVVQWIQGEKGPDREK